MNRTNLEHLTIALIIQCAGWLLCGDLISGALLATGIFIGREHAQREYKLGDPSLLVGYEALDLWRWEMDALLDLLIPVVGVWGVVYFSFLARSSADAL